MSDTSQALPFGGGGGGGGGGSRLSFGGGRRNDDEELLRYYDDVANRVTLLTDTSPWLANQPDTLQALAMNPGLGYDQLAYQSASLAAQVNMDGLAQTLRTMSPAAQRAVAGQLTAAQRSALAQLGYQTPDRGGGVREVIGTALSPLGYAASGVTGAIGGVVGPVLGTTFDALTWVGDRPAHLFRTNRQMEGGAQYLSLAGALLGAIGVAAAPFTGGLSLGLTAGAIAGGALLGSTVGAAITNPTQWWETFHESWDGERVFTRQSQERAREILGGNEALAALARDVAWEGSLIDLAEEFAGVRDATNENMMLRSVDRVLNRLIEPTDPMYEQMAEAMTRLAVDPVFVEAVTELQDGKISFGRWLANSVGLERGDTFYGTLSGAADGLFLVTLDPTFGAFAVNRIVKAARYAVPMSQDSLAVSHRINELYTERESVRRAFSVIGDAVEAGDYARLKAYAPNAQSLFMDMRQWRAREAARHGVDHLDTVYRFDGDEVLRYFKTTEGKLQLLKGRGLRPGAKKIILPSHNTMSMQWARTKQWTKAVIDFADANQGARSLQPAVRAATELEDAAPPVLRELTEGVAGEFGVRRMFRVELSEAERRAYDSFLELMEEYTLRRDEPGFLALLTRTQFEVIASLKRLGIADQHTLDMMDAFKRPKLLGADNVRPGDHLLETRKVVERQVTNEIPAIPGGGQISRPDLMPTAQTMTGQFGMNVSPAAVKASDFQRTRAFVNWVDSLPILGSIERQMGALFGSFTSMIPRSAVNLDNALEIDKFVDLGRVMGVPADVRDAWRSMILTQENRAGRIVAVEAYLDTMLRATGIDVLPEGVDLAKRFLVKYHQSYALNGLDNLWVNGRPRRVGLLPHNDQAIDLVLPDLRELRQAVQRGMVLKYMLRATDYALIDQAVTRVWKPSVLMRIGFIPRAAGEELLAKVARDGISGMLAEWGETSIYRGQVAYDEQTAMRHFGARELTDAMYEEMKRMRVASHLRPLERIFSRFDFSRPAVRILEEYTTAMRAWLERGIAPNLSERMPAKFRAALEGDERSFRRLMLTGSNPDVQEAIAAYETTFSRQIMQEVSSKKAGLWEPNSQEHVVSALRRTAEGTLVEEQTVRLKNEFRFYAIDDPYYAVGQHEQLNHVWSDPSVAVPFINTMARVVPDSLDDQTLMEFVGLLVNGDIGRLTRENGPMSQLMREMIGKELLDHHDMSIIRDIMYRVRDPRKLIAFNRLADTGVAPGEVLAALTRDKVIGGHTRDMSDIVGFLSPENTMVTADARQWMIFQLEHGTWTMDDLSQWYSMTRAQGAIGGPVTVDEVLADTTGYFLTPEQGLRAWRNAMVETLSDPRFNGRVDGSLRAAIVNELPVLNPLREGFFRTYYPSLDTDTLRMLQRQLDETRIVLQQMLDETGSVIDLNRALVDDLTLRYEMAVEQIAATGGARAQTTVEDARTLFTELVEQREYLDELIQVGALNGFEHRVPLTYGGTLDPQSAQAIGDALTAVVRGVDNFQPGSTRIAFMDDVEQFTYGWRRADPTTPDSTRVLPLDSLARIHKVEPVPTDLYVNGNLRSSTEDAFEVWADNLLQRVMQVSRRNNTVRVANEELYLKGLDDTLTPAPRWSDKIDADPRNFALDDNAQYVNAAGEVVSTRDPRYVRIVRAPGDETTEQVLWEIVGPALRDSADSVKGTIVMRTDGQRRLRSTVEQVARADSNQLPEHVAAVARIQHEQGVWDRVVNGFFDQVAGPAIDGIVRTPMARHNFINAYLDAKQAWRWLIDPDLLDEKIPARFGDLFLDGLRPRDQMLVEARHAEPYLALGRRLDDDDALLEAYLGLSKEQIDAALLRARRTTGSRIDVHRILRHRKELDGPLIAAGLAEDPNQALGRYLVDKFGVSLNVSFDSAMFHKRVKDLIDERPGLYFVLEAGGWDELVELKRMFGHVDHQVGSIAAERAVIDSIPFLDSHQIKSQFGEYTRNLLPFWYAEENFLKRWGRTLSLAPEALRKGQLTYMGMKEVGIIETDAQGRDWFTYPGSQLLQEAVGKIPGLEVLPVGAMLRTETNRMLPGFDRVGAPSPSPFFSIQLEALTQIFPEIRGVQRSVVGDIGVNRGILRQFVPATLMNTFEVFLGDENSSRRMASAMMSAAAYMEAEGKGLPDNATTAEIDEYMRRLRRHARTIVGVQALTAFIVPGSPSQVVTGESALSFSGLTGVGANDVASVFREEYLTLVRRLGLEDGTAEFLNNHDGDLSKMAYTVGRSVSTSGAVLPPTMEAVNFYESNADWMAEFQDAGPWLLPPDRNAVGVTEDYAYTQQTIDGLREMRTPEDFLRALKFKEAATPYFEAREVHITTRAQAVEQDDDAMVKMLDNEWRQFSQVFLAQHPIFAEELQGSEGRQRRQRTIAELRVALADPQGPQPWHVEDMRYMLGLYDEYQLILRMKANDRTVATQDGISRLKLWFEMEMDQLVLDRPHLAPMWVSLLRPESSLS